MDKQPRDPAARGDLLDVELHCPRAECAATEIRVRIEPLRANWFQTFRDRDWRCPCVESGRPCDGCRPPPSPNTSSSCCVDTTEPRSNVLAGSDTAAASARIGDAHVRRLPPTAHPPTPPRVRSAASWDLGQDIGWPGCIGTTGTAGGSARLPRISNAVHTFKHLAWFGNGEPFAYAARHVSRGMSSVRMRFIFTTTARCGS